MIHTVDVTIKGLSPLLMHSFPMIPPEQGWEKWEPRKQAEIAVYRDEQSNQLYIPGINIQRCLVSGATYVKGKGRASMQKPVAACVIVSPEKCLLGVEDYVVDSRPVVVPATKGRIVRHRPRLDDWEVSFSIEFDTALISEKELRDVVDNAGSRVGLLDFRPEKKGPFGRFRVDKWEVVTRQG